MSLCLMLVGPSAHEARGRGRPQAVGAHLRDEARHPRAPVAAAVYRDLDEIAALELAEPTALLQLHRARDRGGAGRLPEQVLREREAVAGGGVVVVAVKPEAVRGLVELTACPDPADGAAGLEARDHVAACAAHHVELAV